MNAEMCNWEQERRGTEINVTYFHSAKWWTGHVSEEPSQFIWLIKMAKYLISLVNRKGKQWRYFMREEPYIENDWQEQPQQMYFA